MSFYFKLKPVKKTSLNRLVAEWKEICAIDKDVHVAIVGAEGDGKSHLMCQTIDLFPYTNYWDNVIYTNAKKEFQEKYKNLRRQGPLGFDEALNYINRLDWTKAKTKDLVRTMRAEFRKEKNGVVLYNAQLFRDLHGYFRNHRVGYWIQLSRREWWKDCNYAYVLRKSDVPVHTGKRDVWLLDRMEQWWITQMANTGPIEDVDYAKAIRRHPFYAGRFKFDALPKNKEAEYRKRREEAYDVYGEDITDTQEGIENQELQEAAKIRELKRAGCTIKQIEVAMGMGKNALYRRLRIPDSPVPMQKDITIKRLPPISSEEGEES